MKVENKKSRYTMVSRGYPSIFLIPAAAIFLTFFIVPVIAGFIFSMTDWSLSNPAIKFVGLRQFTDLFKDVRFATAIKNTFIFALTVTVLQNVVGLALAMVMSQKLKTKEYLQTIFFLPSTLSVLIVGYAFRAIFHPAGLLNNTLNSIGLGSLATSWLSTQGVSLFCIVFANLWMTTGFSMTVYLTGIKSIPAEILEAAEIEGVSPWKKFTQIIFPMLASALTINVLMSFIGAMKVFDIVFAMTKGGPGYQTEVFNTLIYRIFGSGRYGYGTAANVLLFLIITVFAMISLKYLRKREVQL